MEDREPTLEPMVEPLSSIAWNSNAFVFETRLGTCDPL